MERASNVVTQNPKVGQSSGVQNAPSVNKALVIDWNKVFHITLCNEPHETHGGDLACCNTALCGADLTNMEWTDGTGEIPCPLCFHTDEMEQS